MPVRGRFAPTPSGPLHLGNAWTALWCHQAAGEGGGRVLRMEDLDLARTPPGASEAVLDDLAWLGLTWDEGPREGGAHGPYLQSQRTEYYTQALELLRDRGLVYPCGCSRKEVEASSQAPHGAEPIYPGTCGRKDPREVLARASDKGRTVAWRLRVPDTVLRVRDEAFGDCVQNLASELGDFVVFRSDGIPAYQLAVVVDDLAMEIDLVVRGEDLLASTVRQAFLAQLLGGTPPRYRHVPLLRNEQGARLAKRDGAIGLGVLRARGVSPERLRAALLDVSLTEKLPASGLAWPKRAPSFASLRQSLPELDVCSGS